MKTKFNVSQTCEEYGSGRDFTSYEMKVGRALAWCLRCGCMTYNRFSSFGIPAPKTSKRK
jgi:hypothetical protein